MAVIPMGLCDFFGERLLAYRYRQGVEVELSGCITACKGDIYINGKLLVMTRD